MEQNAIFFFNDCCYYYLILYFCQRKTNLNIDYA